MALQKQKPLYDPAAPENQFPKMLYPKEGELKGWKIANDAEEETKILADFAAAKKKDDKKASDK